MSFAVAPYGFTPTPSSNYAPPRSPRAAVRKVSRSSSQCVSVEHFNEEPGAVWMERVTRTYPACVWLNPVPESQWEFTHSIRMVRQLLGGRMYPLTLEGLDRAMRELVR